MGRTRWFLSEALHHPWTFLCVLMVFLGLLYILFS